MIRLMLGLAEQPKQDEPLAPPDAGGQRMLGLVEYAPLSEEAVKASLEEEPKGVPVLLGEPLWAQPITLRDRWFWVAIVVSLLLHLAIFLSLPEVKRIEARLEAQRKPAEDRIPPVYLYPYLPHEKVEPPRSQRPPLSDLTRRAHGGEGTPDITPGMRGNTEEPRLEPPRAGASSPGRAAVPPAAGAGARQEGSSSTPLPLGDKGEDAVIQVDRPGQEAQPARPLLKGLGPLGAAGSSMGSVPNRRGGQVDLGPLSFDTEWYDWGPYAAEMLRRIRYHWQIPEIAMLGVPGIVRIHFFIERDGRVTGLEILKESGHPSLDFAARDAVLDASPLPPLPPDLTGVPREGVTIAFYYNSKVPDQSGQE